MGQEKSVLIKRNVEAASYNPEPPKHQPALAVKIPPSPIRPLQICQHHQVRNRVHLFPPYQPQAVLPKQLTIASHIPTNGVIPSAMNTARPSFVFVSHFIIS